MSCDALKSHKTSDALVNRIRGIQSENWGKAVDGGCLFACLDGRWKISFLCCLWDILGVPSREGCQVELVYPRTEQVLIDDLIGTFFH
jgi:hypothetical protein